jgi:hypothetical protein
VQEPFVELMKGSLNTFLNAFTYPDRTCYPVASTNKQVSESRPATLTEGKTGHPHVLSSCIQSSLSDRACLSGAGQPTALCHMHPVMRLPAGLLQPGGRVPGRSVPPTLVSRGYATTCQDWQHKQQQPSIQCTHEGRLLECWASSLLVLQAGQQLMWESFTQLLHHVHTHLSACSISDPKVFEQEGWHYELDSPEVGGWVERWGSGKVVWGYIGSDIQHGLLVKLITNTGSCIAATLGLL